MSTNNSNNNATTSTPPPPSSGGGVGRLKGAVAGDGSTWKEALFGLAGGVAYGLLSPIVGHPFDTIKTKMQAETQYKNATFVTTVKGMYQSQGLRGFYNGFLPPLLGSMMYRGAAFSTYSGAYSMCAQVPLLSQEIPYTGGLRPCVLVGAMASAVVRATIESPLDFIKLRYQLGKGVMQDATTATTTLGSAASSATPTTTTATANMTLKSFFTSPIANIRHLYYGYSTTLIRTMGLLGGFFVSIDYAVRYIPDVVNAPLIGPFFKGGICSTFAWSLCFPFETAKSVIQSDTTGRYKNNSSTNITWTVLKELYQQGGIKRWYRGFGPGAGRSFVANGASMVAYAWFQDTVRA